METEKTIKYRGARTFQIPPASNCSDQSPEIKTFFGGIFSTKHVKQAGQTKFCGRLYRLAPIFLFLLMAGSVVGQIEPKTLGGGEKKETVDRQDKNNSSTKADEKDCLADDQAKSGASSTTNKDGSTECAASGKIQKIPPRRIVDREQVKKYESSLNRFLLAPFRAVSPFINRRLTQFETGPRLGLLSIIMSNPYIHPVIGGLGEGSGFGGGVYVSTADKLSPNFKLSASGVATVNGYTEILTGIEASPKNWARGKMQFNVTGRFLLRPEEDFYGSGANSFESNRTSYFRREHGARFDAAWQAFRRLKFGAFTDFSLNSITDGNDKKAAPFTERFSPSEIPGFARNVRLLDNGIYVEYEGRDEPENPHAGVFFRLAASSTDGLGKGNDYGSLNYDLDTRAYLPLGSKRRVLALRLLGNFKDLKGASTVPLFRLARLGDGETLRGYESYRYQGLNALHLNVEYRFKLVQGIETDGFRSVEAILFTDLGQVYNRKEELALTNVRVTYGGGLQFASRKNAAFTVLYAISPERSRLMFRFGKTF
jgi:hypothetical protein